jgi:hypothetical protein
MVSIVFLDFDGPMIPVKAYYLPNQTKIATQFDPCAVGMLLHLVKLTDARIVISSTHRLQGKTHIIKLFEDNGIPTRHLHRDWHTTLDTSFTRSQEIQMWLNDHPSIDPYIAIDDELLDNTIVSTKCSGYEGFSMANLIECKLALDAFDPSGNPTIEVQRERLKA